MTAFDKKALWYAKNEHAQYRHGGCITLEQFYLKNVLIITALYHTV